MKTIWDMLHGFYSGYVYPAIISLINTLVHNKNGLYFLLVLFVGLLIINKIIKKIHILSGTFNFITACVVILIIIVSFLRFGPLYGDYMKQYNSTHKSSNPTKTPSKSKPSTQSGSKQQTTPSYQTPKQLYYGGGCSGCYADGCPSNGYSYGGYDVSMYNYYRSLCQACQCNSSRWQSLWR